MAIKKKTTKSAKTETVDVGVFDRIASALERQAEAQESLADSVGALADALIYEMDGTPFVGVSTNKSSVVIGDDSDDNFDPEHE